MLVVQKTYEVEVGPIGEIFRVPSGSLEAFLHVLLFNEMTFSVKIEEPEK